MKVTVGVDLASRIAAVEAKALLQDRIHPEHLLFGLLSLEYQALLNGERLGVTPKGVKGAPPPSQEKFIESRATIFCT